MSELDDDLVLRRGTSGSTTRGIFSSFDAEKEPSHDPSTSTSSGIIFYDTLPAASSNVGDDRPRGTDIPRRSMFGYAEEGQSDSPHFPHNLATSSHSHTLSEPLPYSRPLMTRQMHPAPPYNPAFHNTHNTGYTAGFTPSTFPFVSSPLPYNQRTDGFRHISRHPEGEHISSFVYPHPSGVPDTNAINHTAHANYQTGAPARTLNLTGHPHEVPSTAHGPFLNFGSYSQAACPPSHQPSPPHVPGGYASPGPIHSLNYSPPNSASSYGYPHLQGYSPSPPVYPQYSGSPYNQSLSPETNRQRTWWYNANHAGVPLQQSFDPYQRNYPASYPVPHINPYHRSTPLPPVSPPTSPNLPGPSSPERRLGAGSNHGSGSRGGKKPLVRRSYHPNPPSYRSDWVMWTGNIPSNATHDELWRFFTSFPEGTPDAPANSGVLSIFLISRSNCAFINYENEVYLKAAVEHLNGRSLRPGDPRCPKLVCRMRRTDDDLKAGVGGQRGIGMHLRWVKERKDRESSLTESVPNDPSSPLPDKSSHSTSSDDDSGGRHGPQSLASSSSYASTNSSLLARFFPQRYFILKSLTQSDLDLSKENGLWATQKHNEGILDQAFRTSQDVYLIFSVNKSGEFYGYARMVGSIRRGGQKVTWALRDSDFTSSRAPPFSSAGRGDEKEGASLGDSTNGSDDVYFSPGSNRFVDKSPLAMIEGTPKGDLTHYHFTGNVQSAPAELGAEHKIITFRAPTARHSTDHHLLNAGIRDQPAPDEFQLDPMAPVRARRSVRDDSPLEIVVEEAERCNGDFPAVKDPIERREKRDDWGESFKIEWLSTEKISFQKTRNLRNPWNHNREVKVSRDGTELEPSVGRKLIADWASLARK